MSLVAPIYVASAGATRGQQLPHIWERPLSPKLEALAQGQTGANLLPEETWPFLSGIAILWAALYTGFWIASGFQARPSQ